MNRSGLRLRPTLSTAALLLAAGVVLASSCAASSGGVSDCGEGLSRCDGECVDIRTDAHHCGACGVACAGGRGCAEGRCEGGGDIGLGVGGPLGDCADDRTECAGGCVDLRADPRNCGACGARCAPGQGCTDGVCACADGTTACDGACVDLQSDRAHCGECGARCSPTQLCVGGACACAEGLEDCSGSCVDLHTSELHCGRCGVECGRGALCQEGACTCVLGTYDELGATFPQRVTGTTAGGESNYGLACVAAGAAERVYLFTPPEAGTYTLDTFGSTFDTALGVLDATSCAQLGCNDDNLGKQSRVRVVLEAGEAVLIVVTGFDGAEGDFALNVAKAALPRCPSGDEILTTVPQAISGDTALLGDGITPICGHTGSPDAAYTFTAPAEGVYVFDTFGSAYDTLLELRDGGCDGAVLACNDDAQGRPQSRITERLTAGQTVVALVDGAGGESGPFTLNISAWAPPPCPIVELGPSISQSVEGTTSGFDDHLAPPCNPGRSPEVSHSFTAPVAGRYTFDTLGSSFDAVLHVHDGGCAGPLLGCNEDAPTGDHAEVTLPLAEGQTVYVIVDGVHGQEGAYTLNVHGVPAPSCPAHALGSMVPQTVEGTTAGLGDFVRAPCGTAGGAEETYSFTAPSDGVYVFDTFGSSFDTIVHVHDGTCGGASLACNDNAPGSASRVAVPLVAGQAVVVVVDGSGASASGAYKLNVSLFDGDATCASPIDLGSTVPQTVTGSTLFQPDSAAPSCTASSGNDRVYRFTAPAEGTYVIDTQSSSFDTVLHVHDGERCTGAELACNDDASGLASRVEVTLTEGQVITIVGDGRPSASGILTLNITAATP
ncbi:MXAN_6577-like cysteine-rich protein [Sorangium sp. So ce1036]|uniref:MXAN_6577-like cysteine-rich protein n=1 Tax=Sorangium sp. So ce1036 TaxID=3133328 RepID=UPI003F11BF27